MNGGEEPPFKRRRRMTNTILMLPDDLLLNCLARVSKLSYPILSLVSKRFRSIISSTELYQTRIHLGCTESCLYVCLQLYDDPNPMRWFTLCRGPINSKKILVPISSPSFPSAYHSGAAMVGPNIYTIGGLTDNRDNTASSSVMIMDCRSHTWREAPSMRMGRVFQSTCVLDDKIYVIGGLNNLDSTNWIESFDTKTQTWQYFQIPSDDIFGGSEYKSVAYEGTVYVRSMEKNVTYKLHKGRWRAADLMINSGWRCSSSHCMIENMFYYFNNMGIVWYDSENRLWKTLKGLERLYSLCRFALVKLVDYGGKLAVLWEKDVFVNNSKEVRIWCAEIAIEKRQKGEIWGMVEWFDVVFTTNEPHSLLLHVLATII